MITFLFILYYYNEQWKYFELQATGVEYTECKINDISFIFFDKTFFLSELSARITFEFHLSDVRLTLYYILKFTLF